MAYTKYLIQQPIQGTPISSSLFGVRVRDAISNLDDRATLLEEDQQAIIARTRRITAKVVAAASSGTEFGYVRLDNIPVKNGRAYRIMTAQCNLDTDTANDVMTGRIRVAYASTPGTLATTASLQIGSMRQTQSNITQSFLIPMSCFYLATADGYISLMVTGQRVAGTGGIQFFASSTEIFDLTVEYAGPTPADTGVAL